jgi:hypothetical protein
MPLGRVVAAANIPDHWLLKETLEAMALPRPSPKRVRQNLLADKDYTDWQSRAIAKPYGYDAHIPQRAKARIKLPKRPGRRKASRWVVEQTCGNITRARAILIRWSKEPDNYEARLHSAAGMLCFRRSAKKRRGGY